MLARIAVAHPPVFGVSVGVLVLPYFVSTVDVLAPRGPRGYTGDTARRLHIHILQGLDEHKKFARLTMRECGGHMESICSLSPHHAVLTRGRRDIVATIRRVFPPRPHFPPHDACPSARFLILPLLPIPYTVPPTPIVVDLYGWTRDVRCPGQEGDTGDCRHQRSLPWGGVGMGVALRLSPRYHEPEDGSWASGGKVQAVFL